MMETLQERFPHLDPRFSTYLENVLGRLPAEARENILKSDNFQLIADDGFLNTCMLRQTFTPPVQTLAYINTKILTEPERRILLAIASQFAFYACSKEKPEVEFKDAEELLRQWGFEEELDAVLHDEAMEKSDGYKVGYGWAKGQTKDYLLQHFGLFFDEWKTRGWGKFSDEVMKPIDRQHEAGSILEEITRMRTPLDTHAARPRVETTAPLPQQAVLAGIMAALKEIELHDCYGPQPCEIAPV
jgi:hypothetical protein